MNVIWKGHLPFPSGHETQVNLGRTWSLAVIVICRGSDSYVVSFQNIVHYRCISYLQGMLYRSSHIFRKSYRYHERRSIYQWQVRQYCPCSILVNISTTLITFSISSLGSSSSSPSCTVNITQLPRLSCGSPHFSLCVSLARHTATILSWMNLRFLLPAPNHILNLQICISLALLDTMTRTAFREFKLSLSPLTRTQTYSFHCLFCFVLFQNSI